MGIEPTQDGVSALLTVLKTAEPTRTLPPPQGNSSEDSALILHFYDCKWKPEIAKKPC